MPVGVYKRTEFHGSRMREGWKKRNGVGPVMLICPSCGKEFTRYPSQMKKGHKTFFCSVACKAYGQRGQLINHENPNWKGGRHLNKDGYVMIRSVDHPRANPAGYVREHILVVEMAIGKPLPKGAIVHHFNEDRADNRNSNLVVCQGNKYHRLIHDRTEARNGR